MKKSTTQIHAALSKLFPFVNSSDIDEFLFLCQYKMFKNKEIIFPAGSTSRKAAFILSGVTRAYFMDNEGVEKNVMLRVENTFMGLPEWLFESKPTKYTFEAILECELLIFNIVDLENLAKKNPAIFDFYVWILKDMMKTMLYRLETLVNLSPEERYKDLLERYPQFFQTVFNKHIANFLGITPVSLSRIVKRMKENPQK